VVFEDPLLMALPPGSPLSDRPVLGVAVLEELPFIWFQREASPEFYDVVARAFAAAGVRPRVVQEVSSHVACGSLVAAGVGATLVPSSMAASLPAAVHVRPIQDLAAQAIMHAVWRADEASPAVTAFLRILRAARAQFATASREA
jgi:DNA-binding transcriptional LysR family regulator